MNNAVLDVLFAARALLAKIDEVHASTEYENVWLSAQIHFGPYDGPRYVDELEALRKALSKRTEIVRELQGGEAGDSVVMVSRPNADAD